MTAPWEESFDFYMSQMAGDPLAVLVDLGAGENTLVLDESHNINGFNSSNQFSADEINALDFASVAVSGPFQ